jgi:hypothetical protein
VRHPPIDSQECTASLHGIDAIDRRTRQGRRKTTIFTAAYCIVAMTNCFDIDGFCSVHCPCGDRLADVRRKRLVLKTRQIAKHEIAEDECRSRRKEEFEPEEAFIPNRPRTLRARTLTKRFGHFTWPSPAAHTSPGDVDG